LTWRSERGWFASQRDPHIEAGTPARSRANGDGATSGFDAFPDRDEAETFPRHTFELESHTIVGDRQDDVGLVAAEVNCDTAALAVLDGVVNRSLCHTIQAQRQRRRERSRKLTMREHDRNAGSRLLTFERAQRCDDAEQLQLDRVQPMRQSAHTSADFMETVQRVSAGTRLAQLDLE
jgi:hypothetical protein